ncbi:hypothetical protein OAO18_06510 [Francisellaceae bacterium]|nr:hypothetical protein [Francisellaceae bacterium]
MKLKKLITLLGITLATITSGQAFSDTAVDSSQNDGSNEIGYRLGQGFYENSLKQTYSCFSVTNGGTMVGGIQSDSGSAFIYNQDTFSNSLDVQGGIDLSFAVVNTNFNLGYDSENLNNSTNLTFWQYTEAYRAHEINNPGEDLVLTKTGQRAYDKILDAFDKGDKASQNDAIDDFIQTCGTSYIDSYNEGSRVSTEIDLQADSSLTKDEISGK